MIKKLDGYIAGKFLKTFFFVALLFTLISVVINFSEKVDNLIETEQSAKTIICDYYLNFIPFMNGLLWPIYGLLSVIFFTSKMASNSEIICSFSGGVSFYRFMAPYLVCATLLSGMHFYGNHYLIPRSNQKLHDFENTFFRAGKQYRGVKTDDIHLNLDPDTKIYIRKFDIKKKKGTDFSIEKFASSRLVSEMNARSITLNEESNTWKIENFVERKISKDGLVQNIRTGTLIDTTLNFSTKDFIHTKNFKQTMTSPELLSFVNDLKSKGSSNYKKFAIEYHRRSSDAFTLIILTIIGMSIAARKVRGGIGLHLAFGALIGAVFVIFSKFSNSFASGGENDTMLWLGVWIPNIFFLGVSALLVYKAQK